MLPSLRAGVILASFLAMTLPLMPVQALLLRLPSERGRKWARHFPNWFHRQVCRLVGVRLAIEGRLEPGVPTLIISNHVSWLDIPVISAVAPVSFVAKREVATWPLVGTLARLQRTVFVDRERRLSVGVTASEMRERLAMGDHIVLFAEGTSSDGNGVLPFRSALLASAGLDGREASPATGSLRVQTLAIAYTGLHGMAMDRFQRPLVAWYGDMELAGHLWRLLQSGPLDARVRIGEPLPPDELADRKSLARTSETKVRIDMAELLGRPADGARPAHVNAAQAYERSIEHQT
jgi:1-acyl-sn-glycerol-3-phosphate acyltransferase